MRLPSFSTIVHTFNIANLSRQLPIPHSYPATFSRILTASNFSTRSVNINKLPTSPPSTPMPNVPFISSLFSTSSKNNSSSSNSKDTAMSDYPVQKSADEWQAVLSPEQFRVIREKGTEAPYVGKYDKHMPSDGVYNCAACNAPLYTATHKFKSGCGWPAYFDNIPGAVKRHTDRTLGMDRTEITCANCGGHLGHVFKGEGYPTPTDERHCVNSISLNFSADGAGKA